MNILGFDPGADGAMVVITPARLVRTYRFKDHTPKDISDAILAETLEPCYGYLEQVGPRPFQGTSGFSFGRVYGRLEQCLTDHAVPFEYVAPQTWQKKVGLGMKFGTKGERKNAHKHLAQNLYPSVKVILANADAILIAEYGRRTYNYT